jgi:uncharacterized membrane-anchored protein YhcB (DUF1043 family)
MEWWYALTTLLIGAIGGFVIARAGDRNKRRAEALQGELDMVNLELNDYRGRVNQHFARTAELVDALAANSREIYNHLAEGSQSLCDPNAIKIKQAPAAPSLSKQADDATVVMAGVTAADSVADKPDEGWYEILPETDERKLEEPVH